MVSAALGAAWLVGWGILAWRRHRKAAPARAKKLDGRRITAVATTRLFIPGLLGALIVWTGLSAIWSIDSTTSLWIALATAGCGLYFFAGRVLARPVFARGWGAAWALSILGTVVARTLRRGVLSGDAFLVPGSRRRRQRSGALRLRQRARRTPSPDHSANHRRDRRPPRRRAPEDRAIALVAALGLAMQAWALALTRSGGRPPRWAPALLVWAAVWAVRALRGSPGSAEEWPRAGATLAVALVALSAAGIYAYQRATFAFQSPDQARIQTWRAGLEAARARRCRAGAPARGIRPICPTGSAHRPGSLTTCSCSTASNWAPSGRSFCC